MAVESELREEESRLQPQPHPQARPHIQPQAQARDYTYHAGSTDTGRPVYYVVEEEERTGQEELHSDRSPYTYEPADTHTSLVADYTQQAYQDSNRRRRPGAGAGAGSQLGQADSGDFVIREQTYSMCPGCPTFSIPVPVPKSSLANGNKYQQQLPYDNLALPSSQHQQVKYQYARNMTFLEKIGNSVISTMQGLQVISPFFKLRHSLFGFGKFSHGKIFDFGKCMCFDTSSTVLN